MLSSRSGVNSVERDKMISARFWQNLAWIGFAIALGIVGTCMQAMTFKGEDAKQYNSDGAPLNMWWRVELMFGLCSLYAALNFTYLLIAKKWLFYVQYLIQALAFLFTLGNMISDIVVWRQKDTGDFPVVYYAQTEFIMRFWAVIGLLFCHFVLAISTGNLQARLEEIVTAKLVLKSRFDLEDEVEDVTSGERLLNNLYSQIRFEQYSFVVILICLMIALSFRAAAFMNYVWSNDAADFWVTWAWWRNTLDMFTTAFFVGPIALYFLLGGFWTRNFSQYLAGFWLVGVNVLGVLVLAVTWSECNTLNGAELAHPECGTGPTNQVQVWFLWNIYSAIATAACSAIIYTIFFSANHTLREVAAVHSEVKRMKREEADILRAKEENEEARINEGIRAVDAHSDRLGETASDFVHDEHYDHVHSKYENGFHDSDAEHIGMVMYAFKRQLAEGRIGLTQVSPYAGN